MLLYRLKLARELKALVRIVEWSSPAAGDKINECCWGVILSLQMFEQSPLSASRACVIISAFTLEYLLPLKALLNSKSNWLFTF